MLPLVLQKQKTTKFIVMNAFFFVFFMTLYTMIDYFNLGYAEMMAQYSIWLAVVNVFINLVMASLSTLMITFSNAQFDFTGKESKASNLTFASILFGLLTYGCTPCVISFFAAIGITFGVIALPLAGLPYKLISVLILVGGFLWIVFRLRKTACAIKPPENEQKP